MTDEKRKHSSDDVIPSKLLSIVIMGRNDEYMGNFKYRITTCLNYLARNLKDLGRLDDVEILVTDWGSDIPLAKVLPLSPEAAHVCRFVYVPPTLIRVIRPDGGFATYWAANTALRRGKGKFMVLSDADCLFPRHSLQALFDLLNGKFDLPVDVNRMFFFFCRHQVPWEIVQREPSLEEWDRYLLLTAGSLPRDQGLPGLAIAGAGQMMHRSMWHECRGNNQELVGQAWGDAELTLRVTQCYPWMDLSSIGVSLFHMAHWPHNRSGTWPNAVINPHIVSPTVRVNDEDWGLANHELDIQTAENVIESSKTKSSGANSRMEPLPKTRAELVTELTSHLVREHVQTTIRSWSTHSAEWESLCALSWYSLYYYPRIYLEFGIQNAQAATVVAAACPGVEIYGVDSWQVSDSSSTVLSPYYATSMLQRVGYRGYTRLVSGEPATALLRLRESSVGPLSLDLALVRGDMFSEDVVQQLSDLVPHLAPDGMVVFTCASTDDFQRVWREMQAKFPQFTYLRFASEKTAMILAASLQDDDTTVLSSVDIQLQADFWKPPQHAPLSPFRRVCRALRNPLRYPEYAKRICRMALSYLSGRRSAQDPIHDNNSA